MKKLILILFLIFLSAYSIGQKYGKHSSHTIAIKDDTFYLNNQYSIPDSSQYSSLYLNRMREISSYNKAENFISLIDDKMTLISKYPKGDDSIRIDTLISFLPTILPLNKTVIYKAITDSFSYQLIITRTSLTNIDYYYEVNKVKQYSGKVILWPDSELGLGYANFHDSKQGAFCDEYIDEKNYSINLNTNGGCYISLCIETFNEFDKNDRAVIDGGCLVLIGKATKLFRSPILLKE